jgi:hypothetical protein
MKNYLILFVLELYSEKLLMLSSKKIKIIQNRKFVNCRCNIFIVMSKIFKKLDMFLKQNLLINLSQI